MSTAWRPRPFASAGRSRAVKPLTLRRLLWICVSAADVLFVVVVVALKLGAVPISIADLAVNLGRVAVGKTIASVHPITA